MSWKREYQDKKDIDTANISFIRHSERKMLCRRVKYQDFGLEWCMRCGI